MKVAFQSYRLRFLTCTRSISSNQKNVLEHKQLNKFVFISDDLRNLEKDSRNFETDAFKQKFKKLFQGSLCSHLTTASSEAGFPPQNGCTVEVAFIGRSNCGSCIFMSYFAFQHYLFLFIYLFIYFFILFVCYLFIHLFIYFLFY
jgi:hypothetical protein